MVSGSTLISLSIALGMLGYVSSLCLQWSSTPARLPLARLCWTGGWLCYVLHVVSAFHFFHGWDHAHAWQHTAVRTDEFLIGIGLSAQQSGDGIYVTHVFTTLWTLDVLYWWLRGHAAYARLPLWYFRLRDAFMLFITFNGVVVFETGTTRWLGALVTLLMIGWGIRCLQLRRSNPQPAPVS